MKAPDPEDLRRSESPAVVDVDEQGPVFVADATVLDNGWLRLREWDGSRGKVPPHRVLVVRYLETEPYGEYRDDGARPRRIADVEWREQATGKNGLEPVVADD